MRHKLYTIVRVVGTGTVLLSVGAWADTPVERSGEGWDAAHMRSNFSRPASERAPHRVILGSTRYDEPAGDAAAPPTRVPELLLSINPHGWTPGGATGGGHSTPPWASRSAGSSAQGAAPSRSSNLRSSVGNADRGRRRTSF